MKLGVCLFVALVACFSLSTAQVGPRAFAGSWSGFDTVFITGGVKIEKLGYGEGWDELFENPFQTTNEVMIHVEGETFLYVPMNLPRFQHTLHYYSTTGNFEDAILIAFGGNWGWEWFDGSQWNLMDLPEEVESRYGHAAVIVNDELFIYGGWGLDGETLGEIWSLSLTTLEWRKVTCLQPRAGHTMHYIDGFLMIFGGVNEYQETYGEVVAYNMGTGKATCLEFPDCEKSPSPRVFHSSLNFEDGVLMYGGASDSFAGVEHPMDDLWFFDPVDGWSQIVMPASWAHPQGKWGANFLLISDYVLLIGGFDNMVDLPGDIWGYYDSGLTEEESSVWVQFDCWPGYEFPYCELDCREYNYCSGNGLCLNNGTCACDAGWEGANCDLNPCDGYRGFSYEELNDILMPKSLESLFVKLDYIQDKLDWIEAHLPALDDTCTEEQAPMETLAVTSMTFLDECINNNLIAWVYGFDEMLSCGPCGEETKCITGDYCDNWTCVGGVAITPSMCRGNDTDMCIIYACDEEMGCVSSVKDCDDMNACTHDSCNPADGRCINTPASCDDGDCCTFDACDPETGCVHSPVCEDFTLCSVESCRWSECDSKPLCSYTLVHNCYHSEGQTAGSWDNMPLILNQIDEEVTAEAYFWMFVDTCTLKYQITLPEGMSNEGTHIYGPVMEGIAENYAGVVGTLEPSGEIESWNFCTANVKAEDLVSGRYYVTAYLRGDGNEYALRTGISLVVPTIN